MTTRPISVLYMLSWLLPLLALFGMLAGGIASFSLPLFAFVLLPLGDWLVGRAPRLPHHVESSGSQYILEAFVPLCVGVLVIGVLSARHWTALEWVGNTLALGIQAGVGLAASHELGHSPGWLQRKLSRLLVWTSCYGHYHVEHLHGHHVWLGTPHDPCTARRGQTFYRFWRQAVTGSFRCAWQHESQRLMKLRLPDWHWRNEVLLGVTISVGLLAAAYYFAGLAGAMTFIVQAVVGFSLLEAVQYIEHYGLMRAQRADGGFERATAAHSWSSNFRLSNYLMFELQRHADHHVRPGAPFATLGDQAESPMLPGSYPMMILLALVPVAWFRVMHPRLDRHYHNVSTQRGVLSA
ncbi:alkane 1-monooxygenase [Amantichitinum ursilacus]|uniref:Alkane 1-monooxygenase 2 n=1 Tax=Amantichitinum ursilacus TaxID=857265 RepID=A0A0N0XG81_9NEIS|nr:alkane 1-monooxygenase [Amantichitinum ursilacus]KPC49815.1 Alkane 1-monooxygenase 2 [Amantichitinum ursilacus]